MNLPRDAALADFWDARYREGITPWEAGTAPPDLRAAAAAWQRERPGARVLVPGCGSAHDVALLANAGLEVLGIDFSTAAVQVAAQVLAGAPSARVRQADFFDFPEAAGGFDVVYERAFLCALPRRLWPAWAARVTSLVRPGGLLSGYFFIKPTPKGPPFGAERAMLIDLLDQSFTLAEDRPVSGSLPVFEGCEFWMDWRRRPQ